MRSTAGNFGASGVDTHNCVRTISASRPLASLFYLSNVALSRTCCLSCAKCFWKMPKTRSTDAGHLFQLPPPTGCLDGSQQQEATREATALGQERIDQLQSLLQVLQQALVVRRGQRAVPPEHPRTAGVSALSTSSPAGGEVLQPAIKTSANRHRWNQRGSSPFGQLLTGDPRTPSASAPVAAGQHFRSRSSPRTDDSREETRRGLNALWGITSPPLRPPVSCRGQGRRKVLRRRRIWRNLRLPYRASPRCE